MKRSIAVIGLIQIALILATQQAMWAQSPSNADFMATAGQLYEDGEYSEAAQLYQQLVDGGTQDATLYYNLGNSHYRRGELGRAIVNYLRAERLTPRDPDVQANLDLARSQTVDAYGTAGRPLFSRWISGVESWTTLNEVAIVTLILWAIVTLSILGHLLIPVRLIKRILTYAAAITGVVLIVCAITLAGRIYEDGPRSDAVVVAEITEAVSGPGPQFSIEFTLHNGTEAVVEDVNGNWAKIALLDGQSTGWVSTSAIEEVEIKQTGGGLDWSLPF